MTDIASTIQCSSMPMMCCQISTDSPNDAPSDSTHGADDDRRGHHGCG